MNAMVEAQRAALRSLATSTNPKTLKLLPKLEYFIDLLENRYERGHPQ